MAKAGENDVRERLVAYARAHGRSTRREHLLIQLAASKVLETLDFLSFGLEDVNTAQADFLNASARLKEIQARHGEGTRQIGKNEEPLWQTRRRAHWLLQYRIDTFYVFTGILLDDIGAMVSRAIGRGVPAKHSGIVSKLPAAAAARGLDGHEAVVAKAESLTALIKDFRDDYVIHRSSNKPRTMRGLSVLPDGTARLNVSGINYPKVTDFPMEGEEPKVLLSEDPATVMAALEDYTGVVLDLVEPLTPEPDGG